MNKVISHHYRLRRQKTAAAFAAAVIVISGLSDGLTDPIGCDYAHAVAHDEGRVHYRRVAVAVNVAVHDGLFDDAYVHERHIALQPRRVNDVNIAVIVGIAEEISLST